MVDGVRPAEIRPRAQCILAFKTLSHIFNKADLRHRIAKGTNISITILIQNVLYQSAWSQNQNTTRYYVQKQKLHTFIKKNSS